MTDDLGRTTPLLGVRYFVTPFPAQNAAAALTTWEEHPDATVYTDGLGWYALALDQQAPIHPGWTQTCPEELEATLYPLRTAPQEKECSP